MFFVILLSMQLVYLIPIIMGAVVFFIVYTLKNKLPPEKFKVALTNIGIGFCVLSILAVGASVVISKNYADLFKIALPGAMLVLLFISSKKSK